MTDELSCAADWLSRLACDLFGRQRLVDSEDHPACVVDRSSSTDGLYWLGLFVLSLSRCRQSDVQDTDIGRKWTHT